MLEKIKAIVVNRNLLTTLKNTVDFLAREPRVETIIFDQDSTYPPLLEYYKTCNVKVVFAGANGGPHSSWGPLIRPETKDNYFIIADPDCEYTGVPDDWLDRMLDVLNNTPVFKVGFSLEIDDLPDHALSADVRNTETRYWTEKNEYGWVADIDTTFALYRPNSPFSYKALRLDKPYCIRHIPWYITEDTINDEWRYYLDSVSGISTWGSKLKLLIK